MAENLLPNAPGLVPGSSGEIKSFENDSRSPGNIGTTKSYPESEPCKPIAKGAELSYKGGSKAGSDGNY